MSRFPLIKTVATAAALAFGTTAAMIMFSTTAPAPAHADIPAPLLSSGTPSLAPMLKDVVPAVVNVSITSKVEVQNPLLEDPFFRRFFGVPDQPQQQEREAQAIGSGVIVDAAKGYVLTNNHVVEQADTIKVTLADERTVDAKLVGRDPATDIAVLQIKNAKDLKQLSIGDSDKLQVGDFVVAIGSPFGLQQTVTSGIVSGLSRQTNITEGGYEDFIQTDASINPGNSGGALVNLKGELVGIPSNILSGGGGSIGIGFAIPINIAKGVMKQLIETGSVERGRIGVGGQDLTPELAKAFNLPTTHGAVVSQVVPGSPAAKAGIKQEDVITEVNGKDLHSFSQLRNMVGLMRVGEKVDLTVVRDGKPRTVTVTIGKNSEQATAGADLHPRLAGATFAPSDESNSKDSDERGIVVQKVEPRSPAARSGLRPGDVITAVNRHPVTTMAEFEKYAGKKESELLLHVRRQNGALFLLLQ
ncbi:MAG TPA: DegQ family serine endoprotease [Nevskiaceae bacterium]|nr:DegQ family serine endoprotease [Nevskiaceae bacterium]